MRGRRVTIPEPRGKKSLKEQHFNFQFCFSKGGGTKSLPADEVFEHRTLARTLPTDDCNLRQIEGHLHAQ